MLSIVSIGYIASICLLASVIMHVLARKIFPAIGLLDFPERYNLSRKPLPYPTGIVSVLIFCTVLFSFSLESKQATGLLIGIICLATVSFIDDRWQISPLFRIILQIIVAFIIFGTGTRIYSITSPFALDGIIKLDSLVIPFALFDNPPILSGIFTIIWLVLTMNSLNWFDGIPGQVNVISCIGFTIIGLLAISDRLQHVNPLAQQTLAIFAFSLAGISVGAGIFDFPPAKVVMGDTGAMFLGLMLGVLTIYSGGKVATALLVLGVPIIDSVFVVLRRIFRKKAPWKGSATDEHLHHRLLLCKWSPRQIIACTASIGSALGISALFMSTVEKMIAGLVLITIMTCLTLYTEVRLQSSTQQ